MSAVVWLCFYCFLLKPNVCWVVASSDCAFLTVNFFVKFKLIKLIYIKPVKPFLMKLLYQYPLLCTEIKYDI